MKARSPLFRQLIQSLRQPQLEQQGGRQIKNSGLLPKIDRRRFVQNGLILGMGIGLGASAIRCRSDKGQPKIAIIGAGLAGLTAGYYLNKKNLPFTIYEGSSRVGGRVFTIPDFAAPGAVAEMGGQYIDSSHQSILQLCQELELPLLDLRSPSEEGLVVTDYFFNSRRYTNQEVLEEYSSLAPVFEKDMAVFPEVIGYRTQQFRDMDHMSLEEYLHKAGASPFMRQLFKAAFTCEYGRDLAEQSALNMIYLLPPRVHQGEFEVWGESDERYLLDGGNNKLPEKLAALLGERLVMEHQLEAVTANGDGFTLSFSGAKEVKADVVIITIPFSVLREVDMRLEMPPEKKQAIRELGYGTNSKMALGYNERVWRKQGFAGDVFNDYLQNAWEHTQMQNNNQGPGGVTVFLGGEAGRKMTVEQRNGFVAGYDQIYPGSQAVYNERNFLFNWSNNVYVKGSYTCYLPGQWTAFGGAEAEPVGNLYFAGEHCSLDSQGFMDGSVESGKKAAEAILQKMNVM